MNKNHPWVTRINLNIHTRLNLIPTVTLPECTTLGMLHITRLLSDSKSRVVPIHVMCYVLHSSSTWSSPTYSVTTIIIRIIYFVIIL